MVLIIYVFVSITTFKPICTNTSNAAAGTAVLPFGSTQKWRAGMKRMHIFFHSVAIKELFS